MVTGCLRMMKIEVCVPKCHFPGTGYFPKKSGKFPSIREHPILGPDSVPAFGTGFKVRFISRIFPEFSRVTRPENISLVPVLPIQEMSYSLLSSHSKRARERRPLISNQSCLTFKRNTSVTSKNFSKNKLKHQR